MGARCGIPTTELKYPSPWLAAPGATRNREVDYGKTDDRRRDWREASTETRRRWNRDHRCSAGSGQDSTGISERLILDWLNRIDLFRIKGIGEEYSDLLESAGVDTVPELAQRNPKNLYQKIMEVNSKKKLVRQPPGQGQVADWVEQAKQLPRVIEY